MQAIQRNYEYLLKVKANLKTLVQRGAIDSDTAFSIYENEAMRQNQDELERKYLSKHT